MQALPVPEVEGLGLLQPKRNQIRLGVEGGPGGGGCLAIPPLLGSPSPGVWQEGSSLQPPTGRSEGAVLADAPGRGWGLTTLSPSFSARGHVLDLGAVCL